MNRRTQRILKLRKEKYTFQQIASMMDPVLTAERIRQIIQKTKEKHLRFCIKHKLSIKTTCKICDLEKSYFLSIKYLSFPALEKEIKRLSKKDRKKEIVIERNLLVKRLRDDMGFSFNKIGKLLKRDHTSIIWAYNH